MELNQIIVVLDSLSTGHQHNLDEVQASLDEDKLSRFTFIEGDIFDIVSCREACAGVDYLSYQAALGSVPRSIEDSITTNDNNISGFLNMLVVAKDA